MMAVNGKINKFPLFWHGVVLKHIVLCHCFVLSCYSLATMLQLLAGNSIRIWSCRKDSMLLVCTVAKQFGSLCLLRFNQNLPSSCGSSYHHKHHLVILAISPQTTSANARNGEKTLRFDTIYSIQWGPFYSFAASLLF